MKEDINQMTEDKRLAALWKVADHIPELWGDECKDGYVNLNISADTIEAVQAAICQTPSDNKELLDALKDARKTLVDIAALSRSLSFNKVAQALCRMAEKAIEPATKAISQAKEEN